MFTLTNIFISTYINCLLFKAQTKRLYLLVMACVLEINILKEMLKKSEKHRVVHSSTSKFSVRKSVSF